MTGRCALRLAFLLYTLGLTAAGLLPLHHIRETARFARSEPHFNNPAPTPTGIIRLRNDGYGKGHYYASRNRGRKHKGIDIAAPTGTPVIAAKSGRVSVSDVEKGYGEWIEILHPDGLVSRYAHLSERHVRRGEWVHQDQVIGAVGKTGNAVNPHILPHLHFEIRYKSHSINPLDGLLSPDRPVIS